MKDQQPWYLKMPWAQIAVGSAVWWVWHDLNPSGAAQGLRALAPYAATGAGAAGLWWWRYAHPKQQTIEDIGSHTYISGLTRQGKTALAILLILKAFRLGRGGAWLSIKGARGLLPYLPVPAIDLVDLLCPTAKRPRGPNLLRLYTDDANERQQVADQVATLFARQHSAMSENMMSLIRSATDALLEYGQRSNTEVALTDLYRMVCHPAYRRQVMAACANPVIRDAIDEAEGEAAQKRGNPTWAAVVRQIRRPISSEVLQVTFSQTGKNAIDIREIMHRGRWLVVDASDGTLGPEVAGFINQVVASKVQLLTPSRDPGDDLFGVFADECQEYGGNGEAFAKAIALAAEYKVAWHLINQSEGGQLSQGMQTAVNLCGNKFYFRQAVGDAEKARKSLGGLLETDEFVRLPKRHYAGVYRLHGETVFFKRRKTQDLPPPSQRREQIIREANETGPTAAEIRDALYATMKPEVIDVWAGKTQSSPPGATPASSGW